MSNILIGVGGTGAKVVEAMLHLAATGVGPAAMDVGFIDQDKSNGNVARAGDVLDLYVRTRQAWRAEGAPHRLGNPALAPLLRTAIAPLHERENLWVPDPAGRSTLAGIFGEMGEDQLLFDCLYSSAEQQMELDEGYRGKPHIGSAAITAHSREDRGFWKSLLEEINRVGTGQQVRILLAGSVFGGTGAAGFPTVARLIRDQLARNAIDRNVAIGGVLMLPYFSFGDPSDEHGAVTDVAISSELLRQSRGALRHYQWQLDQSRVFDELYFVGWNDAYHIDYHERGTGKQKNPALLPELIAAVAGYRFFDAEHRLDDEVDRPLLISARHERYEVRGRDVPPLREALPDEVHQRILQFLRFAAAYKEWRRYFGDEKARKTHRTDGWFERQRLDKIDWEKQPPRVEMDDLTGLIDRFLEWAGSIEAYAERLPEFSFKLWQLGQLVTKPDFATPTKLLAANPGYGRREYATVFESIVVPDGSDRPIAAAQLADRLNEERLEAGAEGLGQLVASMYAFSHPLAHV